jgi:hypothetical protein
MIGFTTQLHYPVAGRVIPDEPRFRCNRVLHPKHSEFGIPLGGLVDYLDSFGGKG